MNLEIINKYFSPDNILDIGGNTGGFYNLVKKFYPESKVFIIEGNGECEDSLSQLNTNYLIRLLGKQSGSVTFYRTKANSTNTGNSIYKEITKLYDDETVIETKEPIFTLDEIFDQTVTFDLIKLDTQGSELDILAGGKQLCSKAKGILLEVSFYEYNIGAPLYPDVVKFMNEYGFSEAETIDITMWEREGIKFDQRDILFINKRST